MKITDHVEAILPREKETVTAFIELSDDRRIQIKLDLNWFQIGDIITINGTPIDRDWETYI